MRLTQDNSHHTAIHVDRYVVAVLRKRQADKCACGVSLLDGFQVAHKRYGIDITINDLELKCGTCHAKEHGVKGVQGLLRGQERYVPKKMIKP